MIVLLIRWTFFAAQGAGVIVPALFLARWTGKNSILQKIGWTALCFVIWVGFSYFVFYDPEVVLLFVALTLGFAKSSLVFLIGWLVAPRLQSVFRAW